MKQIILILLILTLGGCSDDNSVNESSTATIIGSWNINKLTINSIAVNYNDMGDILRKIILNNDSSAELFWYDKLELDEIEACTFSKTEKEITFLVSNNNEIWTYSYNYELQENTLQLSRERDGVIWIYQYSKTT